MPKNFNFETIVSWLKSNIVSPINSIAILDGENAVMHKSNNTNYVRNFFTDCKANNYLPIIVAKVANLNRFKKRIPNVDIPDDVIYFFLHGDNKKCPDDAFIIELYSKLKDNAINTYIFSIDKFANRKSWDSKIYKTMISYNTEPARPRNCTDPNVIIYKPDIDIIINTVIDNKICLRLE